MLSDNIGQRSRLMLILENDNVYSANFLSIIMINAVNPVANRLTIPLQIYQIKGSLTVKGLNKPARSPPHQAVPHFSTCSLECRRQYCPGETDKKAKVGRVRKFQFLANRVRVDVRQFFARIIEVFCIN